jgi:NAD-dependent dihydropyrimidine dehydrogenase PreA subunit
MYTIYPHNLEYKTRKGWCVIACPDGDFKAPDKECESLCINDVLIGMIMRAKQDSDVRMVDEDGEEIVPGEETGSDHHSASGEESSESEALLQSASKGKKKKAKELIIGEC